MRNGFIRFKEGRMTITRMRVLFMDVEALHGLVGKIMDLVGVDNGSAVIYAVAKDAGGRATRSHFQFCRKTGSDMAFYMAKMASGAGWGRIRVCESAPEFTRVIVEDSPFAKRPFNRPSCDYIRGFIAGSLSYIYRCKVDCVEFRCASCGVSSCEFVAGKREALLKMMECKPHAKQLMVLPDNFKAATIGGMRNARPAP